MATKSRNYRREYDLYQGKPEQIAERTKRVLDRRKMEAEGKVKKGDGMDVDHIRPLSKGGSSGTANLRAVPKAENRSFARTSTRAVKSQTSKRERTK